jgi:hypothetical protein
LSPKNQNETPVALQNLLIRLLTVNGEEREIEWSRLRDFLRLAQKASSSYDSSKDDAEDKASLSRQTIELFFKFLTSRTGIFLKKPLVHELAEAIDGMASIGEASLLRFTRGMLPPLPGMNGPVNARRMDELKLVLDTFQDAIVVNRGGPQGQDRMEGIMELLRELVSLLNDDRLRDDAGPMLAEIQSVFQLVAVEVLEIRGSRAMRSMMKMGGLAS